MGKKAACYVKLHHSTLTSEPKEYVFFFSLLIQLSAMSMQPQIPKMNVRT